MKTEKLNILLKDKSIDYPQFHPNGLVILEKRYLRRDTTGKVIENPQQMLARVAYHIAQADQVHYGASDEVVIELFKRFYGMMARGAFLPNSPTLMNAGTSVGQLSACFVLPIEDDMAQIFETLKNTALVHKSGGGTGFSFSNIRPQNDIVSSTGGEASGPISFMRIFNAATEEVKQGGKRRGANMGILRIDHPDILAFISCKDEQQQLNNFNISIAMTDDFMEAVKNATTYQLINPKNKQPVGELEAAQVFDQIIHQAWKNGEPGVIYIDRINAYNPTPQLGPIESTNPCGEQPLLPYESCNLGSINLEKFICEGDLDFEELRAIIDLAVHFLDNVIDVNDYPLERIGETTRANRKIGLGIMGWANTLIRLGIPYDSEAGVQKAQQVMTFIQERAQQASRALAKQRGAFDNFVGSIYDVPDGESMRNATVTTIAPTGTISMLANTSSGIEPLFGVVYQSLRADSTFIEINGLFEELAKAQGFWHDDLPAEILAAGSIRGVAGIPENIQRLFVTAGEMDAKWHIKMQAAFQSACDNAVSKTINFNHEATVNEIKDAYLMAYDLGCKGLTVYRDGSRDFQVLNKGTQKIQVTAPEKPKEQQSFEGIRPCDRPQVMTGISASYVSACSNFYVTVNGLDGLPFEVFCNSVGQGGCQAQITAVATLTTLLLRSGVAIDEVTKRLNRIQCPACIRREGIDVPSCPAAIGRAIEHYMICHPIDCLQTQHYPQKDANNEQPNKRYQENERCPECGSELNFQEGCHKCSNSQCFVTTQG